jgi:hypothetical protein
MVPLVPRRPIAAVWLTMSDIRISVLESERDERAYTDFLMRHDGATVYHSLRYRDVVLAITRATAEYALAWRGDDVVGTMPVMTLRGRHGEVLNSLPFFGSYGNILASCVTAARALAEWFYARLDKAGVAAATVIENPFGPSRHLPRADMSDERIAQWTELTPGANFSEQLLTMIDGSARRNIQRARAAGIEVTINHDAFDFLAESHRQNMQEIGGRTKPPEFFDAVRRHMIASQDYRLYVARYDGQPIAALLIFYFKHFAEYIMPTTIKNRRELQPTAAILHRAMCDAQAEGRRIWNWGGTWLTQNGVYRFKRKWAAREASYSYHVYVRNPKLMADSAGSLSIEYPYFYTVRFGALREAAAGRQ